MPTTGGAAADAPPDEEPLCYDTPRDAEAAAVNAETLEIMALTPPSRLVPLIIDLVELEFDFSSVTTGKKREVLVEERKQQLEPYQTPILERLRDIGATHVSSAWITNSVNATISARDVAGVLCWPHVVRAQVDAGFWTIADPPWSSTEAGPEQCPLQDGGCPEHCFEVIAAPVVDHVACGCTARPVTCSREPYGIDDDEPTCRRNNETGETLIFRGLVPDPPGYRGFQPCSNVTWEYVDECGRSCFE